jgi:hypothetical protein
MSDQNNNVLGKAAGSVANAAAWGYVAYNVMRNPSPEDMQIAPGFDPEFTDRSNEILMSLLIPQIKLWEDKKANMRARGAKRLEWLAAAQKTLFDRFLGDAPIINNIPNIMENLSLPNPEQRKILDPLVKEMVYWSKYLPGAVMEERWKETDRRNVIAAQRMMQHGEITPNGLRYQTGAFGWRLTVLAVIGMFFYLFINGGYQTPLILLGFCTLAYFFYKRFFHNHNCDTVEAMIAGDLPEDEPWTPPADWVDRPQMTLPGAADRPPRKRLVICLGILAGLAFIWFSIFCIDSSFAIWMVSGIK